MKTDFVTTNIRLPKEMLKALKLKAVQEDKSLAFLVRQAIQNTFFKTRAKGLSEPEFKREFFKIVGLGKSRIRDGSIHHDRYIYGERK